MPEAPKRMSLSFDNMFIPEAIPSGEEVHVEIVGARFHSKEDSDNVSLCVMLRPVGKPKAQLMTEYIGWPTERELDLLARLNDGEDLAGEDADTAQKANAKLLRLQRFCKCFDIENTDFDLEDQKDNFLIGRSSYVIVEEEPANEFSEVPRNRVKKWQGQ